MGTPQTRQELGRAWLKAVKEKCPDVKWKEHYALLGAYDFMDIYDAPDAEQAAKVSLICTQHGAVSAETVSAIPYKRYLELISAM